MITYTEKGEVTAYLKKLEKKRKFSGEETGQILLLANINNKYINAENKEKVIEDIDFIKLLNKAEKSLNNGKDLYIYDIYKTLHGVIENYFYSSFETLKLCLSNLEAIYERVKLTFEIEYSYNYINEIKKDSYLYKNFSLDNAIKTNFTNQLQYENLAEVFRRTLAYNELLKILEKQYNIYNLYDCYKFDGVETYKYGVKRINTFINNLIELLPSRKEEIKKLFYLIDLNIFKPSEENIKDVSELIKDIGLNYSAINKFRYHFNDYISYLTIDCISDWEKDQDGYTSIEILNRINKLEVKEQSGKRESENK